MLEVLLQVEEDLPPLGHLVAEGLPAEEGQLQGAVELGPPPARWVGVAFGEVRPRPRVGGWNTRHRDPGPGGPYPTPRGGGGAGTPDPHAYLYSNSHIIFGF